MTKRAETAALGHPSPKSISDAVNAAHSMLQNAGITDVPRLEAEALLADVLGMDRAKLLASSSGPIHNLTEYFSLIRRRIGGEPFAYITGNKEFMGLDFSVDGRVLIPRPETEILVELVIEKIGRDAGAMIIDIGTGSGCVAISLAVFLPHAFIHATDISSNALFLARENAARHNASERIMFSEGSVYSALPDSLKGRVDIIVSNPPYISDDEYAALERGIIDFEPQQALKGGADGLDVFRKIVAGAPDYLNDGGMLAVEIGETQAADAAAIMEDCGDFSRVEAISDLSGRPRIVTGIKSG
jgi:release factor glutamine methyltransferase